MAELKDLLERTTLHKLNDFKTKLPKYSDDYKERLKEIQVLLLDAGINGLSFKYNNEVLYAVLFNQKTYKPVLINSKLYLKHANTTESIKAFIISAKAIGPISILSGPIVSNNNG